MESEVKARQRPHHRPQSTLFYREEDGIHFTAGASL